MSASTTDVKKEAPTLVGITAGTNLIRGQAITAPEFRDKDGKREYLLGFVDKNGNQQHFPTDRDLYIYAAGRNIEGTKPDGLDMLTEHAFHVYVRPSKSGSPKCVALDVIPTRQLRSEFTYVKQEGVEYVTIKVLLGGKVLRVEPMARPSGLTKTTMLAMFAAIRKHLEAKPLEAGVVIPGVGRVEAVDGQRIQFEPHKEAHAGKPMFDTDPER